jgi:small GTP-binding protein
MPDRHPQQKVHSDRMQLQPDCPVYRVVMIGESQTGKTSIVSCLSGNPITNPASTVGASLTQRISVRCEFAPNGVLMNIWDTAGQEKYRSLAPMYYKNADAAMAVFDLTNEESLTRLNDWIQLFFDIVPMGTVFVLGNKSDLTELRQVKDGDVKGYLEWQSFRYFATSAKTGDGIQGAFQELAEELFRQYESGKGQGKRGWLEIGGTQRAGGCC